MGCSADNSIQIDLNNERERKNKIANPASPDPNFPDMEEWPGDRYKGIGIKRMKGYKCTLPINELNEMRENFWTTKIEENSKWRIIQQICVFDEERANLTLGHYNFQVAENCVNHIIDNHGKHYFVPNYCINDPYFEKELIQTNEPEKKIKIFLYDVSCDNTIEEEFSNHDTGKTIKKKFFEKIKLDENKYNIRLFFSGTEIKNSDFLYQHGLDNDYKIQVMKIKK